MRKLSLEKRLQTLENKSGSVAAGVSLERDGYRVVGRGLRVPVPSELADWDLAAVEWFETGAEIARRSLLN